MDGYFDNPIGQMPGSAFLALYSLWFLLWLMVARLWGTFKQPATSAPVRIPSVPDPFQIAYLRGGVQELLRTLLVDLVEKNEWLRLSRHEPGTNLVPNTLTGQSPILKTSVKTFRLPIELSSTACEPTLARSRRSCNSSPKNCKNSSTATESR
jgi:hypothetical protein